jgi:ribosome-binding protein aMBF1 (putative translation factor)
MSQPGHPVVYATAPKPKPKPQSTAASTLYFGPKPKPAPKPKDPEDDGDKKPKHVTPAVSAQIQKDRLMLGWKQKELAQKSGVTENVVTAYEKGTAIHNQGEYQKIRKALDAGQKRSA